MKFVKQHPVISYSEFLNKLKDLKRFSSSSGKRYEVDAVSNEIIYFLRLDANNSHWKIDLRKLYLAYTELEDFNTENFKPYLSRTHSPGRGLLIKLNLLREAKSY